MELTAREFSICNRYKVGNTLLLKLLNADQWLYLFWKDL